VSILAAVPVAEWGRSCWEWIVDTTFQLQVPFVSWSLARGNCSALCVMHAPTAGRRACLQLQLASIMAKVHTKWLSGRLRFYLLHTTSDSRQARGAFQSNCSPLCAVAIWFNLILRQREPRWMHWSIIRSMQTSLSQCQSAGVLIWLAGTLLAT